MRERAVLRGPMTPLFGETGDMPLEAGLVERSLEFVRCNTRASYPDKVVGEAVVNALTHRNYVLAGSDIKLAVYRDRLEVVSPGGLFKGMTLEKIRAGMGNLPYRNQLLTDVMRHYGYMDGTGMGVFRKIVRGMKEHNGTVPDLVEEDERFIVRLFAEGGEA